MCRKISKPKKNYKVVWKGGEYFLQFYFIFNVWPYVSQIKWRICDRLQHISALFLFFNTVPKFATEEFFFFFLN